MFAIISVLGVWPEERMRESMRKPYIAGQYIYSNQVMARNVPGKDIQSEVERIANEGFLKLHPFVPERLRTVTEANRLEAGRLLTKIACANCHALEPGAPLRNIPDKLHRSADPDLIAAFLRGPLKHGSVPYMPHIDLPEQEIKAIEGRQGQCIPAYRARGFSTAFHSSHLRSAVVYLQCSFRALGTRFYFYADSRLLPLVRFLLG